MINADRHPEQQEDEVFFINIDSGGFREWWQFRKVEWKTKRLGRVAYDTTGKRISDMKPVFVLRSELKKAGIDPDWREKSSSQRQRGPYQVESST